MRTAVLRLCGQRLGGPIEVVAQSNRRMRRAMSPSPANRRSASLSAARPLQGSAICSLIACHLAPYPPCATSRALILTGFALGAVHRASPSAQSKRAFALGMIQGQASHAEEQKGMSAEAATEEKAVSQGHNALARSRFQHTAQARLEHFTGRRIYRFGAGGLHRARATVRQEQSASNEPCGSRSACKRWDTHFWRGPSDARRVPVRPPRPAAV